MAKSLFWKEKVALTSLLFLLVFNSHAQTSSSKNISYTCRATELEAVINVLSRQSGYDFVYSSSIIDVSKPISLTVKDKSINEVLRLIEPQADVLFKIHDRHIVIKSNPKPIAIILPQQRQAVNIRPAFATNDNAEIPGAGLLTSTSRAIPMRMFESQATQLENHLNKRIIELQQLLGANMPHSIPKYYVNRINISNRYKGWYVSLGTYVNDNASGLELQAGVRYLYGVFVPRWSADHGFYGAYGIGSSIQVAGGFSINAMYVYSGYTNTDIVHHSGKAGSAWLDSRDTEVRRHHQVKLALRYAFNENLSLRAGPVFNYRSTFNQLSPILSPNIPYGIFEYQRPTRVTDRWVGAEIALQYRINFYKKDY
jgi:hypothetical protein